MCLISSRQIKNLQTSTLAFDIAQLFPSLNHQLLPKFLNKAGFNPRISGFFSDYLISKKTQYLWNSFTSSFFNVDVDIEQGSVLSPILSVLYLSPIFHIFQKQTKNLNILVSLLSFVDDGLIISQKNCLEKLTLFFTITTILCCFYSNNVALSLSMGNLKFLIFLGPMASLILLLFISLPLENLSFILKKPENTQVLFSTENYSFDNTSPTIQTKYF